MVTNRFESRTARLAFLLVICSLEGYPQELLTPFVGHRITSQYTCQTVSGPADSGGKGTFSIGKTSLKTTISREVFFSGKGNEVEVSRVLKRVQIKLTDNLASSGYDSDNPFDEDAAAARLGAPYGPLVKRAEKRHYRIGGEPSGETPKKDRYMHFWSLGMPSTNPDSDWEGFFFQAPGGGSYQVGKSWADTLRTGLQQRINRYKVVQIQGDAVTLGWSGQVVPTALTNQIAKSSNGPDNSAKDILLGLDDEGTLTVSRSEGLIMEGQWMEQERRRIEMGGQTAESLTTRNSFITNKLLKR